MSVSFKRGLAAVVAVASATLILAGCATAQPTNTAANGLQTVTAGKLTIATGEPAYEPWVIGDKPESGKGFEAAIAYAVAKQLGYSAKNVVWVRTSFDEAIAPGLKNWDFNLQQFSITDERKKSVDFSSPYYETTQAVVTVKGSKAAGVSSVAGLKGLAIGAASGTTSFNAIESIIKPTSGAKAFNNNDDAVAALQAGQIDALVVDLPTALYLSAVEITDGVIAGQLPNSSTGGDQFGLVLEKDSKLTSAVSKAVDALKANGTLAKLADKWLANYASAPVLK